MKTALAALIALVSINASAATDYSISAPYIVPTQLGVNAADIQFCPTPETAVVVQGRNLKGLGLTLAGGSTVLVSTTPTGSYPECQSDMLCLTHDTFSLNEIKGSASITRNNDGEYPTTNLPGYSSLSIHLEGVAAKKGSVDCYYNLSPAQ